MKLTGLPRTLLFTLRARAEEHGRSHPIITDPLAAGWYSRISPTPMDVYTAVFQLGTAVRARLYDNIARQFIQARRHSLIVELGAGLSTRFDRLKRLETTSLETGNHETKSPIAKSPHWIELDLPLAIAFRRQFDRETERHTFLPASMTDPGWPALLPDTPPQDILFIAEGVLFFLPPNEISKLFTLLRRHFPGAAVACDVLTNQFSPNARAAFAATDTPMQWFVNDETDLAQFGLTVQDNWVVTHLFLERWQALGFDAGRLQANKGNIVISAKLRSQNKRIRGAAG